MKPALTAGFFWDTIKHLWRKGSSMQHKLCENLVTYSVLSNGDLLMEFQIKNKLESITIPGGMIIEQDMKSKKYSTFVGEYAQQYFSVRSVGTYQIRRSDYRV